MCVFFPVLNIASFFPHSVLPINGTPSSQVSVNAMKLQVHQAFETWQSPPKGGRNIGR